MEVYKLYEVGGCVRDRFLGLDSKDIDYTFEFTTEFLEKNTQLSPLDFYNWMNYHLKENGFHIFLEVPEAFTTRAKFPLGHANENLVADFVLARKEKYENPESRTPTVEIGTLYDDLKRRDFTVNAIAQDEEGNIIDPFNGQGALKLNVLRCPTDAKTSFNDDPLRMLRALRFSITKGFRMNQDILKIIHHDKDMWEKFSAVVSQERIREELYKMFNYDTVETINLLTNINRLASIDVLNKIFGDNLWLKPTNEKR